MSAGDVSPHNIHTLTPDAGKGRELLVSVVIPVYNGADLLVNTLDALNDQRPDSPQFEVHVADDGSEQDILSVVGRFPDMNVFYHRRERDRFGAGQARNLGIEAAVGDVIVFLDSDCLAGPDFILGHASWHTSEVPTVLIGGRSRAVMGSGDDLTDYRKRLRRRTSGLQVGNEIFRSFVTANVSVKSELLREVGRFDERFHRWGGEDTELGWRLWNSGATFIDDDTISVTHQVDEDVSGGESGRRKSHQLNMGLIASLIPHRFYRREVPPAIPEVPKASVVVYDVPEGAAVDIWSELLEQPRSDFELIVVADIDSQEPMAGASVGDPRLHYVSTEAEALRRAHGEYVCLLDGHGAPSRELLTNIVRRLDRRPTSVTATVGYALPADQGGSVRSENGARDVDRAWGAQTPLCWFIRTRELRKLLDAGADLVDIWTTSRGWDLHIHWSSAAVSLPGSSRTNRPGAFKHPSAYRQQLATEVVTRRKSMKEAVVAYLRHRGSQPLGTEAEQAQEATGRSASEKETELARYIGWSGNFNLGDEVMLAEIKGLLPWADIQTSGDPGRLLILGGGTLINRSSYLKQVSDRDTPRVERCVLGTGVASPEYWGQVEDPRRWLRWLSSCAYVGVRGPHSLERLGTWGFEGTAEVSGDSALLIERPEVAGVEGRVLVAPAWTKGKLWGESDSRVVNALTRAIAEWREQGREVVLLASSPDDDGQILQINQQLGEVLPFIQGYTDHVAAVEAIASSDLVVGERLHACVLAAAVGTPFVPIEYRPKLRDFAASVAAEHLVIRTDEISPDQIIEHASQAAADGTAKADQHVSVYRQRLRSAAERIERAVRG